MMNNTDSLLRFRRTAVVALCIWAMLGCDRPGDAVDVQADTAETRPELTAAEITVETVVPSPLVLFADGQSAYSIVLQPGASPSEEFAAHELQTHFKACTGFELPIANLEAGTDTPMIVLGFGTVTQDLGISEQGVDLGTQGFVVKTVDEHVAIAGTPAAGTLYGVHRFCEEHLGVRWFAPDVTRTPTLNRVEVPRTDRLAKPAFLWRNTSYRWPGKDDDFLARMADNAGDRGADSPHGIEYSHDGRAHSYFWYVNPDEFFDEHPEYFSEIGGIRQQEGTQLCLTNPEVLDIVTERMLKRMEDDPQAQQHNFSQMDRYNYCQCDKCSAMNKDLGTAGGTQFWFVNELAKRTSEVYPEKLVGTLAYMYTEEPPADLEMHPNAAVWLCHMYPSCDSHPIATCPENADYKRRAEAWAQITDHLYVWHYIVDFTHYYNPFPNFTAMVEDMRFYRDIGVEGIYLQGMSKKGGGGEFSLLRPYYGMKLLWDPDQDPAELRREFVEGYYGAAHEPILKYIDQLHAEVASKDIHMHLYTNPGQGYLSDPIVAQGEEYFDEAEALAAGDEELLEKVKVARMPLVYARMFPRNGYKVENDKLVFQGELAEPSQVTEFLDRMKQHGFESLREVGGDPEYMALFYSIFNSTPKIWPIENGHLRVEVVPNLGGRALRIVHLGSGQSVTASNVITNLFFPFCGGLEDRVGGIFEFYGWVEPATASEFSQDSITVTTSTINGWHLSRTLTLAVDAPSLMVKTSLTNPAEDPREVRLRSHLELDLGGLEQTKIQFTNLAGQPVAKDLGDIIAGLREGEHYYADQAPAGSWMFTGPNGLKVTQTFDNAQVDFAWAYAYPASAQALELEIWAPRTVLAGGETLILEHEIEVHEDE